MADTKNENKFDGIHTAPVENHKDIDLKAIPPNGSRPVEVDPPTGWVLGVPGLE